MKKIGVLLTCLWLPLAFAKEASNTHDVNQVRDFLKQVFADNQKHVDEIEHEHFKSFSEQQTPRATVVSCADSRVQSDAYHQSPVNDLFFIRNIGNQIQSTLGSVEYGVEHLHTPILLIIGHSQCGAIAAALGDYSQESSAIRKELDFLHLPKSKEVNKGVVENVHNQVDFALKKFEDKIKAGSLIVVGAVYDFRDDFKEGHGRLMLINLNGEKDKTKLQASPYLKGIKDAYFGVNES